MLKTMSLGHCSANHTCTMTSTSQIKDFFKDQTIFLTGGSGFLGKVLIEKLLRECQDLRKLYVLLRPKKGKGLEERFDALFHYECFELIKSSDVDIKQKVSFIAGDTQLPLLGIADKDLEILRKETTCVIHAAANVKFDQGFKEATLNVRATKDLLEMAKEMVNLKVFVYISTAYSNCINSYIKEDVYTPPMTFEKLFALVNALDEDTLKKITPKLLGKWPNTYVYTKSISESLVANAATHFPLAIVRPAIVTSSAEEPMQGWTDNIYGTVGVIVGIAAGVIRVLAAYSRGESHLVPVDYVCNFILAVTARTAIENSSTVTTYNYVGSKTNPLTWGYYFRVLASYNTVAMASDQAIWTSYAVMLDNKLLYNILRILYHTIPAYIIDGIFYCIGKPRRAVKLYQKIDAALESVSYFCLHEWIFDDANMRRTWDEAREEDKRIFNFCMDDLDWEKYIQGIGFGVKKYVMREVPDKSFRRWLKQNTFLVADYLIKFMFWYLIYKFVIFFISLFS